MTGIEYNEAIKYIDSLPPNQATVIRMKYLDEYTLKEIESITGVPVKTVKNRIHEEKNCEAFYHMAERVGSMEKVDILIQALSPEIDAKCAEIKQKKSFALQYEKTSEALKRHSSDEAKMQSVDRLAGTSDDICDILLLDDINKVIYSANKSDFASDNLFELKRVEGSKFLQIGNNSDTVFRFVKKDEFMLSSVFADDFEEIYDEYDEDNFYLDNYQNKKLYLISLLGNKDDSIGVLVYLIYKHINGVCGYCGAVQYADTNGIDY